MAQKLSFIEDINPRTKNWTVKVQVVEKGFPRNPPPSPNKLQPVEKGVTQNSPSNAKKFQRVVLLDSKETRVQACVFANDIELFGSSLSLFKKYYISNAIVRPIPATHKVVLHEYQWIINNRTLVEEVTDDNDIPDVPKFSFVMFSDFQKYLNSMAQVDVIALAISISPPKQLQTNHGESTIREIVMINQEEKPLLLTMWDHFVTNECAAIEDNIASWPVIAAMRLKVVSFNGLSLSTKSSSSFMINPNIPEAATLHSWSLQNEQQLKTMTDQKGFLPSASNLPPTKAEHIVPLTNLTTMTTNESAWVRPAVSIINSNQKFWYMGCNRCYKSIAAQYGRIFNCIHCNRHAVTAEPRCRFEIQLQDDSGILMATVFGKNAEKLFMVSAMDFMNNTNEDGITDAEVIKQLVNNHKHLILVKPHRFQVGDDIQQKYNVVTVQDDLMEGSSSNLA